MKFTTMILLSTVVALVVVPFGCTETIPPKAMTRTRMIIIEWRVREFYSKHQELPARLSDLPPLDENRDSSVMDGWGRSIQYSTEGRTVVLLSLGRDGQAGGKDEDSDIRVTFSVGAASGTGAQE